MTKVALGLCVVACVCELTHVYTSTFLHMLLGFQKYKQGMFFKTIFEVWNESYVFVMCAVCVGWA